jgi:hypothetical protein
MLEYRTVQYSLSIKSFTDFSGGYERFKIKRYSPGTDFGIRARGEERKVGKGGVKKGPEIRPKRNVFVSFSLTAFPFCKTFFELEHEVGNLSIDAQNATDNTPLSGAKIKQNEEKTGLYNLGYSP